MRNKMLEMEQRAKELGRKFIVIANMSYGGVAIAPITEERNGDTYIVGTEIPVWYTKVGSTESHNNEFVLAKDLFTPEQLRFLIRENPLMTVVDGSTSVSNPSRTSAHIPDGFKGYRNFFIILNQVLYGRVNPADFYEDEDFVKGLMDTPSAKELMQQIQGVAVKPRAPNAYKFRFWYERKQDDTKEQFLYLRVGKKKDTIAPKTGDVNTLDSPTCLFIQSAVHPQDVPVDIKNNFIGETHTPAYFDDKEHFKEFYLDYEEGYGVVLSKRYTYLARNIFREFMKSQGRDLQVRAATQGKSRSIDTVVLDLDGTLTATDAILDNGTVRVINSLLQEGMRVVIITEDIEENLEDRLSKIAKTSNLSIFSDGGTKGYSFNETGHKVYSNDYNVKSAIQEDLKSRVRDIISSNFVSERWQEDNRDSSMVNEIKRTSDHRIDLRFVKDRSDFVSRLKTLLNQAGIKTKVYKIGKAEVKISLQDKADALRYLLERDSAIDSSKVLIVGDSARSDRNDRALLTSFPEAVSVNVGSFSPTISNENHSIVQYDRGGINATLMLLSNLELFKRLAENLIVPSSKGQSDEYKDTGASLQAAASPVIYFDADQNKAMDFLKNDPRAWVIFADMLKLSLRNDYYGMNIADIFIADAIRITKNVVSKQGGIGFRLGERSDEVAMVLPGSLQPEEIKNILQDIQIEIKKEYQSYYIARLRDGLTETVKGAFGVMEAQRTARDDQGGDTEYITTVLFVKDGADTNGRLTLDRILKESGLDSGLGEIEEALPPYLSAGAVRLQEEGFLENKFDSSLHKAEIFQGIAKQANQLVGVEGLNKIPDTKVGVKLDDSAFSKLKEYMAKFETSSRALREFVKARYGDNEAMQIQLDDGYAAFMRRNLYEVLEYTIEKSKSADSFIFMVRGPPDNFYIITAAQGKWQITAVRQNILTVEGSSLEKNFLSIIEESGRGLRAKGKYPFKVINDFEELGHYFGNQLIKLDNLDLLDAFNIQLGKVKEKNGILGEQSINVALSDASNKINSLLDERGLAFSVNFEAVSVTSDDFTGQENQTSAGKAKAVLEIIEKLNAARKTVDIPDNSAKFYSEYKNRWPEIEKEIGLIAGERAQNAESELIKAHKNFDIPIILAVEDKQSASSAVINSGHKNLFEYKLKINSEELKKDPGRYIEAIKADFESMKGKLKEKLTDTSYNIIDEFLKNAWDAVISYYDPDFKLEPSRPADYQGMIKVEEIIENGKLKLMVKDNGPGIGRAAPTDYKRGKKNIYYGGLSLAKELADDYRYRRFTWLTINDVYRKTKEHKYIDENTGETVFSIEANSSRYSDLIKVDNQDVRVSTGIGNEVPAGVAGSPAASSAVADIDALAKKVADNLRTSPYKNDIRTFLREGRISNWGQEVLLEDYVNQVRETSGIIIPDNIKWDKFAEKVWRKAVFNPQKAVEIAAQELKKQEELLGLLPTVNFGTLARTVEDAMLPTDGYEKLLAIDESRRIGYSAGAVKLDISKKAELDKYVEGPAQRLVEAIIGQGGIPYSSNAYGFGLKGVFWIKDNKKYFTSLAIEDYRIYEIAAETLMPEFAGSPDVASSAVEHSDKGGIDFRALPAVTQPILTLPGQFPVGTVPVIPLAELNNEWRQIENMLNAGIIPSSDRIKEYLQASCQKQEFNQDIDKVLSCIADILRLEEERVAATDASLKEMLALLESDKPAAEMQFALAKITVEAKEPKALKQ